jgi:hypothetical protein
MAAAVHDELRVVAGEMLDFLDHHVRARSLSLFLSLSLVLSLSLFLSLCVRGLTTLHTYNDYTGA